METQTAHRLLALLLIMLTLLAGCAEKGADEMERVPTEALIAEPTQTATTQTPNQSRKPEPQQTKEPQNATAKKEYEIHGFVNVSEEIPFALLDVRYYSAYNFVGRRIDGYEAPVVLLTREAARALSEVADDLQKKGYLLKLFDGYRPQRAVDCFVRWAADEQDQTYKAVFYPNVPKDRLLSGYIAKKSGHSRGSTVDLTIVRISTGQEVDMGTSFDFLDERSHHGSDSITETQTVNRQILKDAMTRHGFKAYSAEWWHYTLLDEPYPDTYFDFPVE